MPGDEYPTAAILSPTPIACSALTACGLTLTAAPISPKAGAVSKTSALIPRLFSACAAAIPASPPPTIANLQLDDIRPSSALSLCLRLIEPELRTIDLGLGRVVQRLMLEMLPRTIDVELLGRE